MPWPDSEFFFLLYCCGFLPPPSPAGGSLQNSDNRATHQPAAPGCLAMLMPSSRTCRGPGFILAQLHAALCGKTKTLLIKT
jgi:hypothetical protein